MIVRCWWAPVLISVLLLVLLCLSLLSLPQDGLDRIEEENRKKMLDDLNSEHRLNTNQLVAKLASVALLPPPHPADPLCTPPPDTQAITCRGETGLLGERLTKPNKVAMMILFAFEADTLEIMLRDSQDILDYIFIVESTKTHKKVNRLYAEFQSTYGI